MREIKFRLIKDGKIVGYELHKTSSMFEDHHVEIYHGTDHEAWHNICSNPWRFINHDEKNSFIGLLDKNGKEIWEEDIVKRNDWLIPLIVGFKHGTFCYINKGDYEGFIGHGGSCEVIGNIYSNPELLEE